MNKSDRESVICINEQDRIDGWFNFWTTEKTVFNKLCKKIGGENNLISVKKSHRSYDCVVPIRFWSKARIGIKGKSSHKGNSNFRKNIDAKTTKSSYSSVGVN